MSTHPIEVAEQYFAQGYACSQSLLAAFAPRFGLDPDLAFRLAGPFGGGIGRMGEVCGAVSGACMVLGLAYGNTRAEDKAGKERAYQAARQFAEQFRLRHDTILCRQLVGMDISTPAAVQAAREQGLLNHCPQFVHDASQIVSTMLDEGTPS